MSMKRKRKPKRVYHQKMCDAAKVYCKEANRAYKARAYFCALVARCCELEALLRIFDFVETRRPKERSYNLNELINRAFAKHWIPHDALHYWKRIHRTPLKTVLHEIRKARNGVHAHLFDKDLFTRRTASNVTYVVHEMYAALEIKNARNFMKGDIRTGGDHTGGIPGLEKERGKD